MCDLRAVALLLLFSIPALSTTLSFTNKKVGSCLYLEDHTGQPIADQVPTVWQIPLNNATKVTVGVPANYRAWSHRISSELSDNNLELSFIWWGSAWTLCVDLEKEPPTKIRSQSQQCERLKTHAGWPKAYALQHPNHYQWTDLNANNSVVEIMSDLSQIVVNTTTRWSGPTNMTFVLDVAWWGYPFSLCADFQP